MQEWILVVAADLRRTSSGNVVVGSETARVCRKAAKLAKARPEALVCAPAGWSKRYNVFMGEGPMKAYLLLHGLPEPRFKEISNRKVGFNTNGEMNSFAKSLPLSSEEHMPAHVTLVVRWWHAPRAYVLLKASLRRHGHKNTMVEVVPVSSLFHWRILVEPAAWIKNIPNYF